MANAPHNRNITEGPLLKAIGWLTAPMLVGAVLQNMQSLIDLFWVGGLGSKAVAAVAMSATIIMVLFPMLMGLSTGTIALVARAVGAGNEEEASTAASQSLILAFVLGIFFGVIGWLFSDDFFHMLGAAPEIIPDGSAYLKISLLGGFTVFILFIANAALQGAGDTMTPMWVMAVSNVLNIILAPLFIFGIGPLPRMNVEGAAVATVLSQAVAAGLAVHIMLSGKARLHIRPHHWTPNPQLLWRILRIGLPGSGQMFSRSLMSAVMMWIVAGCGTAAVAAYGVGLRFHMIILMPAFALGGAAATMVGQNLGAGKPERARHAAWVSTWIGMGFMVITGAIMVLFAPGLIRVFNREPDVVRIGAQYLQVVSPFYIFAALGIVLGRALNGAGDSMSPMIITILSLWGLQVPLAVFLSRIWQPPTQGIWWAIVTAFVVQGLLVAGWFETGRWKHRKV